MERRCRVTDGPGVQETLQTNRVFVRELKAANEFANTTLLTTELPSVKADDQQKLIKKTYNAPTVHQVAVRMPNDPVGQRDFMLHTISRNICSP